MSQPLRPPIYRQEALAKLASPEELDRLLQITTLRSWLLLGALGSVLLIGLLWAVFGTLSTTHTESGLLTARDGTNSTLEAVVYVPLDAVTQLAPGMQAQIAPVTAAAEQYGYLNGTVVSVAHSAASRDQMRAVLTTDSAVDALIGRGALYEVRITLTPGPDRGYRWSASHGPTFDLVSGTPCQVVIVIREERPLSRVFPLPTAQPS